MSEEKTRRFYFAWYLPSQAERCGTVVYKNFKSDNLVEATLITKTSKYPFQNYGGIFVGLVTTFVERKQIGYEMYNLLKQIREEKERRRKKTLTS